MPEAVIRVPGGSFRIIQALVGFREDIERQLERFPFEKNVFLMMRFRKQNRTLSDFIIRNLSEAGLNGVRADQPEWNLTNNVYNPVAVLYCCKYGIALFDKAEMNQAYNPNVIYELGIMHSLGRKCLILRNDSLPAVPFDLIKDLYMPYRGKVAVQANIRIWLQQIMPGPARPEFAAKSTGRSKLADAAVSAREGDEDSVVMSPDHISATEFTWRVLSKDKKSWKVLWKVSLANKRRRAVNVQVQVLFLDKNGFALDDHMGPPMRALPPDETRRYEATATLSPDLANRIQRAVATVSKIR